MFVIIASAFGAAFGSFVNVIADRSIEGRSWWGNERSSCSSCRRVLSWPELIPVLSFLFQSGRCRGCGKFFGFKYLIVEIIGASIGGLLAARWGFSFTFFAFFIASFFLLINALTDFAEGYIFDVFSLGMLVPAFMFSLLDGFPGLLDGFLGALLGLGVFASIIIISRGGMGWGDAFLMCGLGGFLGWKLTIIALYIGIIVAGAGAVVLMIMGRVKFGRRQSMVLGPFLSFGGFVTFLCGDNILRFLAERFHFF